MVLLSTVLVVKKPPVNVSIHNSHECHVPRPPLNAIRSAQRTYANRANIHWMSTGPIQCVSRKQTRCRHERRRKVGVGKPASQPSRSLIYASCCREHLIDSLAKVLSHRRLCIPSERSICEIPADLDLCQQWCEKDRG